MPLLGLKHDIITFRTILLGLVHIDRYAPAQEILNEMHPADLHLDTKTCGLLFDCLCQSGYIDEAIFLFHMMGKRV